MTTPAIPDEAIQTAATVFHRIVGVRDTYATKLILEAAAPHMQGEVTALIAALTDPEDCHFDHHGGCQAHGYLDLKIGELCPHLAAKAWAHNHKPTK